MVYTSSMATDQPSLRQSVSLPSRVAKRVKALARTQKRSANRILVELIESGLESKAAEKSRFFVLTDRLVTSTDPNERKRIKQELARMTFGE